MKDFIFTESDIVDSIKNVSKRGTWRRINHMDIEICVPACRVNNMRAYVERRKIFGMQYTVKSLGLIQHFTVLNVVQLTKGGVL